MNLSQNVAQQSSHFTGERIGWKNQGFQGGPSLHTTPGASLLAVMPTATMEGKVALAAIHILVPLKPQIGLSQTGKSPKALRQLNEWGIR